MGRDFLIYGFRPLQRERSLVLVGRVGFWVPSEDLPQITGRGGAMQTPSFGSISPGGYGMPGIRAHLHRRHDRLLVRAAVDVREAHLLHCVQVVEVAPVFLEAMRRRQSRRMVAQVVLTELTRRVAEVEQELGEARRTRVAGRNGLPGNCGGIIPVRSGYMPVTKALRPEVQLASA